MVLGVQVGQAGPVDDEAEPGSHPPGRARLGLRRAAILFAVALITRAAFAAIFLRHYTPVSDASSYLQIAGSVAHGKGFVSDYPYLWLHPTAFRPPLYPLLLGSLFAITGTHVIVAQLANVVVGSVGVVLLATLATRLAGKPSAGLVAGGLATVFPPLLFNDVVPLTEPLSVVLLASVLILLLQRQYLFAGLLAGLLVLTRTSAQLFIPILAIWVVSRIGWRAAAGFVLAVVVIVAPWVIRNQVEFHKPVIVTSNGFNLAAIWSDQAQRAGHFVDPALDPSFASVRHYGTTGGGLTNLNEANLDAAFRKVGLAGLRRHLSSAPHQLIDNVRYLTDASWKINDSAESLDGRNIAVRHAVLPFIWLGELAWLAAFIAIRRRPGAALLIMVAAYFFAVALVTVSPPRLRALTDALGMVAIGVATVHSGALREWIRRRRERHLGVAQSASAASSD